MFCFSVCCQGWRGQSASPQKFYYKVFLIRWLNNFGDFYWIFIVVIVTTKKIFLNTLTQPNYWNYQFVFYFFYNLWLSEKIFKCVGESQTNGGKGHTINKFWWEREGTMGCLLHWSPKFYNNVFFFVGLWGLVWILIGWLVNLSV